MFVIIFRVAKLAVTQEGNSSVFKKGKSQFLPLEKEK